MQADLADLLIAATAINVTLFASMWLLERWLHKRKTRTR